MASCNLGEKIILWKIGMRLGSWWWLDIGKRVGSIYIVMYMICWRMEGAKEGRELTSVTTQGHPISAFTPSFILLGSRQARRIHVMFSILLWSPGLQLFDTLSYRGILRILEIINLSFDPVLFFSKVKFRKGDTHWQCEWTKTQTASPALGAVFHTNQIPHSPTPPPEANVQPLTLPIRAQNHSCALLGLLIKTYSLH